MVLPGSNGIHVHIRGSGLGAIPSLALWTVVSAAALVSPMPWQVWALVAFLVVLRHLLCRGGLLLPRGTLLVMRAVRSNSVLDFEQFPLRLGVRRNLHGSVWCSACESAGECGARSRVHEVLRHFLLVVHAPVVVQRQVP